MEWKVQRKNPLSSDAHYGVPLDKDHAVPQEALRSGLVSLLPWFVNAVGLIMLVVMNLGTYSSSSV